MATTDIARSSGIFFREALRDYDPTWYTTTEPQLWGALGLHVPATPNLDIATREQITQRLTYVGEAEIYDGTSTDIPISEVAIETDTYKTRLLITGQQWSIFDLEAARKYNQYATFPATDWLTVKMNSMKVAIDRRLHRLVWAGDSRTGMGGLLSNAAIPLVDEATNLYTATPTVLYDWFRDQIQQFKNDSYLVAGQNIKALVPSWLYHAMTARFDTQSSDTPLSLILDAGKGISLAQVVEINETRADILESAGVLAPGTNKDMILFYIQDSTSLSRSFYPLERTEAQLSQDGLRYQVTSYMATSEVKVLEPYKFRRVTIPKHA